MVENTICINFIPIEVIRYTFNGFNSTLFRQQVRNRSKSVIREVSQYSI